jgi:hypothetical protein
MMAWLRLLARAIATGDGLPTGARSAQMVRWGRIVAHGLWKSKHAQHAGDGVLCECIDEICDGAHECGVKVTWTARAFSMPQAACGNPWRR